MSCCQSHMGETESDSFSTLRQKFKTLSPAGLSLLTALLCYDPAQRINAEEAGKHEFFDENPLPKHPDLFPSFPSQAAGERCVSCR